MTSVAETNEATDPVAAFIDAACVPLDDWHASGTLERAESIRAAHPEVARSGIFVAALLGDDTTIRRFVAADPASTTTKGGPRGWDALTYLCFSRYLRLDPSRSHGFVRAAEALLDAGASANAGWFEKDHQPEPEWESVLYGACGIAHHAALTRLLLDRGANPNDSEVTYHAPESSDNDALKVLVEVGKPNADSLATMLLRKADWHDEEGIQYLLERGADPNRITHWGGTAFQHAIQRDNALANIGALLDHGGDPTLTARGRSGATLASRRGRADLLEMFERRGMRIELHGVDRLLAACARHDAAGIRAIANDEPQTVQALVAEGGAPLAEFSGVGNADGVRHLLDLGVPVDAPYQEGDGYFGIAKQSLALHVAAWRAHHATVQLLIERGSPIDTPDGRGRTPLALAVMACVHSFWSYRRSPESVQALLRAGAAVRGIEVPTGYAAIDELLLDRSR